MGMDLALLIVEKDYGQRFEIAKVWPLAPAPTLPDSITEEADRRQGYLVVLSDIRIPHKPCATCEGFGSIVPARLDGVKGSLRPCPTCVVKPTSAP